VGEFAHPDNRSAALGLKPYFLGDTSALARLTNPEATPRLSGAHRGGPFARCTPTDLEAGYSSPDANSHRIVRRLVTVGDMNERIPSGRTLCECSASACGRCSRRPEFADVASRSVL
jgi:hypothetical protein